MSVDVLIAAIASYLIFGWLLWRSKRRGSYNNPWEWLAYGVVYIVWGFLGVAVFDEWDAGWSSWILGALAVLRAIWLFTKGKRKRLAERFAGYKHKATLARMRARAVQT